MYTFTFFKIIWRHVMGFWPNHIRVNKGLIIESVFDGRPHTINRLIDSLLLFKIHKIAFTENIFKMCRQIIMHPWRWTNFSIEYHKWNRRQGNQTPKLLEKWIRKIFNTHLIIFRLDSVLKFSVNGFRTIPPFNGGNSYKNSTKL